MGTLSYKYRTTFDNPEFEGSLPDAQPASNALLCTRYITGDTWHYTTLDDKQVAIRNNLSSIYIRDDSYDNATKFRAQNKGVIVAYRKK